jgi:hypothetical protein
MVIRQMLACFVFFMTGSVVLADGWLPISTVDVPTARAAHNGSHPAAFLAPGTGTSRLTLQSTLSFKADGIYTWRVRTISAQADKVIANGVTIEGGAQFNPIAIGNVQLPIGTSFIAIGNTAANPIAGTFGNLPDGSIRTIGNNTFQADYEGGDGNDLTLTVVP